MTSQEIREQYLRFFEKRGHQRVRSAPVVPRDDPTLYFTNAGMNQFKDVFLGLGKRDYTRAVDTQKCIRVSGKHNDLEEVGVSPRHHTFFEMLGNWSFGDYFKKEAIEWAWELFTEDWGLDKRRLWATVFEGDEQDGLDADVEAEALWRECTDVSADHIVRLPAKDVFWEMGETGPCGPSSELHIYVGDDVEAQDPQGIVEGWDGYLELWNLVFIQFNRDEVGALHPLPDVHVDTGLGFERICSVLQGAPSNYETDIFQPIIDRIAAVSGRADEAEDRVAMRVIADHIRALTFAIADGALPANDGAGYVLRRILRRAARYGRQLDQHEPFIHGLTDAVVEVMGDQFPEIAEKKDHIALVIRSEEESFGQTLDRGIEIFERLSERGEITGADAFQLYDTYGFPLDLTELMARERGLAVDTAGFENELEAQRQRGREATRSRFRAAEGVDDTVDEEHSEFVGYDRLRADARIVQVEIDAAGAASLLLDRTPFYAEAGGQVGDRGRVEGDGFAIEVDDVVKGRGGILHVGRLVAGDAAAVRGAVSAQVDAAARLAAARNHTSTHLLNQALRDVLGDHVAQMGSLVAPERLRFDFSHFAALSDDQQADVEGMVNDRIRANLETSTFEEDLDTARQMGAQALFGEKYEERVRVVKIGDFSLELCGGTHVEATGEIGLFSLLTDSGIAAGTRRAEALSGDGAEQSMREQREAVTRIGSLLNGPVVELADRVDGLLQRNRDLERELGDLQREQANREGGQLAAAAVDVEGIKVVATRVQVDETAGLRTLADGMRESLGSGVGVMGAEVGGKVSFIAVVTDDLIADRGLKAGDVVKGVARLAGGSGGGKPHLAQAGGKNPEKMDEALDAVPGIVRELVR